MARIFIISKYPMFAYGLENLLQDKAEAEVAGQQKGVKDALEQIKETQPDVVILDSDQPAQPSALDLVEILQANPGVKVVGLSLRNNHIYTYQSKCWITKSVDDLIKAINSSDGRV